MTTDERQALRTGVENGDDEALSLESTALAPFERFFPSRPLPFMAFALVASIGTWFVGLYLVDDRAKFLSSPEWRFMPLYLAAHMIAVRLFVTAYTRSFNEGVQRLDVPQATARRDVRRLLGAPGMVAALLVAAPFCFFDYLNLVSVDSRYARMGGGRPAAADYLMWATRCLEWFLNALIWVMLIGFLIKNLIMLARHPFRAPIEIVVHERHYRPFLRMSSQGASIVLGFGLLTIAYLAYTGGELTDYTGLGITALLLLVGFMPPWFLLKRKVRQAVDSEAMALRHSLTTAIWRDARQRKDSRPAGGQKPSLEQKLDEALGLFRMTHLEQLKLDLGRREARAVFIRLLAPVLGGAWQLSQNLQSITGRMGDLMRQGVELLTRFH